MADPITFTSIVNAIINLTQVLSKLQQTVAQSFINLAANNIFTGTNSFTSTTSFSNTATFSGRVVAQSGMRFAVRVVSAAGAVTVTTADYIVVVNKTVGAATTVNLPATPGSADVYIIKDGKGDAGANNITITPAAGNIDGAGTSVISTNFGATRLAYNGVQWNLI